MTLHSFGLKNKVAVAIGGTSGIGQTTAIGIGQSGRWRGAECASLGVGERDAINTLMVDPNRRKSPAPGNQRPILRGI